MIVDADGNTLIDFGSGIAVVSVGNAAPRVAGAGRRAGGQVHPHLFMVTPYEGYVEVCEELARRTPGPTRSAPRCSTPARKRSRTR